MYTFTDIYRAGSMVKRKKKNFPVCVFTARIVKIREIYPITDKKKISVPFEMQNHRIIVLLFVFTVTYFCCLSGRNDKMQRGQTEMKEETKPCRAPVSKVDNLLCVLWLTFTKYVCS